MDTIDELRAFVATAQTGSFTRAADQLGVSNRLTSKYVADLERRLGVRLLQRTTRKVGLTPAGEDLLARAPALIDDLDDLFGEVSEGSRGLTGVIRISAPVTFGEAYVAGMLGRFARQNPDLSFDLRLNDSYVDLASEGIDLAFRMGQSEMLSLKARKLGSFVSLLVASPDYLARQGAPSRPADLIDHACIVDTNRRMPNRWVFPAMARRPSSTCAAGSRSIRRAPRWPWRPTAWGSPMRRASPRTGCWPPARLCPCCRTTRAKAAR
ncbi:Transcriptional regulator, LysR family [Salipiger mucosus DSM 16094]|uniref:Transcriptional regulator, LysR family n=1 Tax=Salipiger mucosus DSM 16094 TaxID=1123237 RepID=S9S4W4_9RHOB|nr:Transcriptional regulator, LysR family [Salipiger mucosus DSM 16094]